VGTRKPPPKKEEGSGWGREAKKEVGNEKKDQRKAFENRLKKKNKPRQGEKP